MACAINRKIEIILARMSLYCLDSIADGWFLLRAEAAGDTRPLRRRVVVLQNSSKRIYVCIAACNEWKILWQQRIWHIAHFYVLCGFLHNIMQKVIF